MVITYYSVLITLIFAIVSKPQLNIHNSQRYVIQALFMYMKVRNQSKTMYVLQSYRYYFPSLFAVYKYRCADYLIIPKMLTKKLHTLGNPFFPAYKIHHNSCYATTQSHRHPLRPSMITSFYTH